MPRTPRPGRRARARFRYQVPARRTKVWPARAPAWAPQWRGDERMARRRYRRGSDDPRRSHARGGRRRWRPAAA